MNRQQLKKCEGQTLRLRPMAVRQSAQFDDDWTLTLDATADAATLTNLTTKATVVVGFDHIHSYTTDLARGGQCGFLAMLSQVLSTPSGQLVAEPLSPRAAVSAPPQFNPIVVNDGTRTWRVTWRDRDAAVHVLPEDQPRQLLDSYKVVCDALRHEAGQEPQFDNAKDIRHEIVWGLSPDHSVKYRLLGGMGGQPAQQVLVLTHNQARQGVTYTGAQATAIIRAHATVSRLSQLRDFGIDNLLNRSVKSAAEQDQLDGDRHKWLDEVVQLLRDAGAAPSDVSAVNRLGTYTPKNLQPLLGVVAGTVQPAEIAAISARNRKHRNEMAERLDRLLRVIQTLEK